VRGVAGVAVLRRRECRAQGGGVVRPAGPDDCERTVGRGEDLQPAVVPDHAVADEDPVPAPMWKAAATRRTATSSGSPFGHTRPTWTQVLFTSR
jgi:hypothetical protein